MSLLPAPLRRRDVQPVRTPGRRHDRAAAAHRRRCPDPSPDLAEAPRPQGLRGRHLESGDRGPGRRAAARRRAARRSAAGARRGLPATGERSLRLTLLEGRYHQVKRMVAAAGNEVRTLHRSRFGALDLPADLAPGNGAGSTGRRRFSAHRTPITMPGQTLPEPSMTSRTLTLVALSLLATPPRRRSRRSRPAARSPRRPSGSRATTRSR